MVDMSGFLMLESDEGCTVGGFYQRISTLHIVSYVAIAWRVFDV